MLFEVKQREKPVAPAYSTTYDEEGTGVEYLRRMIEDCRRRDIDVLLVYLPAYLINGPIFDEQLWEEERARELAEEYGVEYVDLVKQDIIDYQTDCNDTAGHLNASGARKVTDCLGRYITEQYDIPDRRRDPAYSGWYEDYEAYAGFKEDNIASQTDLDRYLMLLADKNYDGVFYLKDGGLFTNGVYRALLENLGADTTALEKAGSWLIVRQGGQKAQMWPVPDTGTGTWDTVLGRLQMSGGEVTLDGTLCIEPPAAGDRCCLQAAVLAGAEHRLVDMADFVFDAGVPQRQK